jgi:hypothetical protein
MNNAGAVRFLERLANLHANFERLLQWERAFAKARFQALALQILHHKEGGSILTANIMQNANVWMIQGRDGASFALEALLGLRIFRKMRREYLDGYGAVKARVAGAIHFAHAAGTERRLNFVRTKLRA